MGMTLEVARSADEISLKALLAALAAEAFPTSIMMIDGQLVMPTAEAPPGWRDLRLRTPAGTVTVARREAGVAVVVFGNADEAMQAAQRKVAQVIEKLGR